MYTNNIIQPGVILSDRYLIVGQIGQGGFGRTYLAEDINRFHELCVLKEFSPQVQTPEMMQKAQELFDREANVLYKLEHPQIPRFRELLRIQVGDNSYLFLVQDYIRGETYNSLLNARKQRGLKFTESEIWQLLQQVLPILVYIHSVGVIHRDISPDNLILRGSDNLPVLIDFGGVKEVAATVGSQSYQTEKQPSLTLLGKVGFAPPEQMQTGLVSPQSDLYALAVTTLVLLTGKQPQELVNHDNFTWQWRGEVNVSAMLAGVLDKMLSAKPSDRYQSACQVLQVLNSRAVSQLQSTSTTVAIPASSPSMWWAPFLLTLCLVSGGGGIWWGIRYYNSNRQPKEPVATSTPSPRITPTPSPQFSLVETQRQQGLNSRRQELGIDPQFYGKLVNQFFWEQNPGRILTDAPADAGLRAEWDQMAGELLQKLAVLSDDARLQLGTYTGAKRERWKVALNRINVSSTALYDLADAAFFEIFPQQQGKNFINEPIGQVWHGFVNDKLQALLSGSAVEAVRFEPGTTSKTITGTLAAPMLNSGGKVFLANLGQDQLLVVNLKASPQVLLSVYSPSGDITFLEDSTEHNLSTLLLESGFYEFVIVSTAAEPQDYQISISVTTPPPEPIPEQEVFDDTQNG